ncbi:CYSTEINE-RICH RLK (RECEPTOR-LIKE KINASE) PROTEIN [Salix koriyanagi]|uniref:CYSTEINE-RICH RLK (RECEPTOR-LIKE KINASE) PROTEIN n=1 Tax=Salix koriyanagi TaxID=2511006 RepID=A0A9Q0X2N9_9ROSI|nr:CYSTEINE-RICH RLK (RECEPTOR-LIKE KINASE) PROTEIN [Salix koriyanagi]
MLKHRVLKNQNLQGSLPPDLSRFPYLQEIDLSRNYLDGTIPREWGATQMVNISMVGNRFTGPIPKEIGNISTLANFTVEFNQLSGVLPPELGNLSRLEKLHLTSNKFTGQLPAAFEKLTALKDFRIGDNQFTGEIPDLIQKWSNLQKLVIQGSGLSGPIPPGIAVLEKMTDLRISDLQGNGTGAPFPPLANMTKLKTLILRSCNIIGRIPDFVGEFSGLKTLDLSFNKLDGEIPDSFLGVKQATYIYLTGNQLNGTVPDWIIKDGKSVDLSYNNFGNESSCQQRNINLFGSASMGNVSGRTVPCLRSLPCQKNFKPPSENSSSTGTSVGTVVGIVAAAVVFVFLILGILWWKGCFGQKISMRHGIF